MPSANENKRTKILIAAGGTGGHLFPAQALAEDLLKGKEGVEVLFAGAGLGKNRCFSKETYPYEEIVSGTLFRKNISGLFKSCYALVHGIVQSFKIIARFQPDAVVGFGSFHSFPLLAAAFFKRIPILLFESNAVAGKVNRLFSRCARATAVQFASAKKQLSGKTLEVKMPLWKKEKERSVSAAEARAYFSLKPDLWTFLVFGGSQGAARINHLFCETALRLSELKREFQVIHIAGTAQEADKLRQCYLRHGISAQVKEFEGQMHLAWKAADLVICRSGAATLAEQIAFEVPGILIPFPYAADDHQQVNAQFMQEKVGGAVWAKESELKAQQLFEMVEHLIDPAHRRVQTMRDSIYLFKTKNDKIDLSTFVHQCLTSKIS